MTRTKAVKTIRPVADTAESQRKQKSESKRLARLARRKAKRKQTLSMNGEIDLGGTIKRRESASSPRIKCRATAAIPTCVSEQIDHPTFDAVVFLNECLRLPLFARYETANPFLIPVGRAHCVVCRLRELPDHAFGGICRRRSLGTHRHSDAYQYRKMGRAR